MKKFVIVIAALALSVQGIAQEKYVISAATALKSGNLDEAKENIDKAMANAETKEKPKTLFVKGEVYMGMQYSDKYKASNPYREGADALFKLKEIKPDYEKETVAQLLASAFGFYYNDGVLAYNNKKYPEASEYMKDALKIRNLDAVKQAETQLPEAMKKKYDTVIAQANQIIADCAYYTGKFDEAIPLLVIVKNNPITRTASVYACLVDAYNKQKNTTEAAAAIQEGRKYFPDDVSLRNDELNLYINSGKEDEMIKKLEEASTKDPNNADILFNIATTYQNMANPKSGAKPANAAELYSKAESAYQRALTVAPHNAVINYNFGSMYYNQAIGFNEQMNAITGSSDADQKKYDELKAKRDALFLKSTPFFEEAYSQLSGREANLNADDKNTYRNAVIALKELYARQGKMDKSADMKKKLETL